MKSSNIITLEKTRNFTKAANLCKVSHPTLSMQIQKLEEELKVKIFDRTKKPIELSEIGFKIINQAKKIVIEFNKMDDVLPFVPVIPISVLSSSILIAAPYIWFLLIFLSIL